MLARTLQRLADLTRRGLADPRVFEALTGCPQDF